jgi:hypothetical protein
MAPALRAPSPRVRSSREPKRSRASSSNGRNGRNGRKGASRGSPYRDSLSLFDDDAAGSSRPYSAVVWSSPRSSHRDGDGDGDGETTGLHFVAQSPTAAGVTDAVR